MAKKDKITTIVSCYGLLQVEEHETEDGALSFLYTGSEYNFHFAVALIKDNKAYPIGGMGRCFEKAVSSLKSLGLEYETVNEPIELDEIFDIHGKKR